jgi:transcriptional regulator with XRE-family HTH domain
MDMVAIGKRIRSLRERHGMTQEVLSGFCGFSSAYLSRIESGHVKLLLYRLKSIADALGVTVGDLADDIGNVRPAGADYRSIPVLDFYQVGRWPETELLLKQDYKGKTIPTNMNSSPSTISLEIVDESMEPRFKIGDLVIIDPSRQPRPGSYVVARDVAGQAVFRQYRDLGVGENGHPAFELQALNSMFPRLRSDRIELAIVGTMVEHRYFEKF